MARIAISATLGENWLEDYYDTESLEVLTTSATKVVFRDDNGSSIVFTGKGMRFNDDGPTAGTVTGVSFVTVDGAKLITITGGNYKATEGFRAYDENESIFDLMTFLTAGNDTIVGSAGYDEIIIGSNAGNDTILGKGGEDFIKGSAGNNRYDGGADFDVLTYQDTYFDKKNATKGVVVDLDKGTATNSWGGKDTLKNIEGVRGSYLRDIITGSGGDEQFMGLGGKDVIDGGGGWDRLRYDRDENFGGLKGVVVNLLKGTVKDGFGQIDSVKNIEEVRGTAFNDKFTGNSGDNLFQGGKGRDTYIGGAGSDTVRLETSGGVDHGARVDLRLASGQIQDDGFGNRELARGIENVEGTQAGDIIILGRFDGYATGGDGDDTLVAGAGENWFAGGGGADIFIFMSTRDSAAGTTKRDFIDDFSAAEGDKLDLSGLGAMNFVGRAGISGGTSQLAYAFNTDGNTIVSADIGGDGRADLQFLLRGKIALTETDFILL
ncbi:calcium-binding protein [Ensifer soli]|uniref:calcium-binding protein n=1 Tax=Ciceribacter sp. sgz301302 TaxID=3342379 RepID=UPI0035B6E994